MCKEMFVILLVSPQNRIPLHVVKKSRNSLVQRKSAKLIYCLDKERKKACLKLYLNQLDGVASMVAYHLRWNSTTRKNPPVCNPPLYIAVTLLDIENTGNIHDLIKGNEILFHEKHKYPLKNRM